VASLAGVLIMGWWETDGELDFGRLGSGLPGLAAFATTTWPRYALLGRRGASMG
jgi:hypothetical protein